MSLSLSLILPLSFDHFIASQKQRAKYNLYRILPALLFLPLSLFIASASIEHTHTTESDAIVANTRTKINETMLQLPNIFALVFRCINKRCCC